MRLGFFAHECDPDAAGIDISRLEACSQSGLPLCLEQPGPHEAVLPSLNEIEINLVCDPLIAKVHEEFMDDPTATDVITFQHGEIFVSIETAIRCAGVNSHPATREAVLYVIHGFLHLNGHSDSTEEEGAAMNRVQESILLTVWPFPER